MIVVLHDLVVHSGVVPPVNVKLFVITEAWAAGISKLALTFKGHRFVNPAAE